MIKDIINRLEIEELINLLPGWQRPYFLSELNSLNIYHLREFLLDSLKELINDKEFLINIIECLSSKEFIYLLNYTDLNEYTFSKRKLKQDITLNKINVYKIKKIKSLLLGNFESQSNMYEGSNLISNVSPVASRFFELLDYQMFIKEKILSILDSGYLLPRLLVHMPTGTGKTKTTMHTITQYYMDVLRNDGLILWVAHTNILLEQAISTLENVWNHLGNKQVEIHRIYGGNTIDYSRLDSTVKGIVFCNISSLINLSKKNSDDFQSLVKVVNLIVFDEAHKVLASETRQVINMLMIKKDNYSNKALIGLTATPGRNIFSDEENERLAEFFEKRILQINIEIVEQFSKSDITYLNQGERDRKIIKYFQERKILSKLKREVIDYNFTEKFYEDLKGKIKRNKSDDYANDVIQIYSKNIERNKVIINRLIQLYDEKIPTIFFACSVEHGKLIASVLKSRGISVSQVYSDTSVQEREKDINNFKKGNTNILINVSVLSTGFDSTNIKCVFIARPTKSIVLYSQMIGRGLRGKRMGGNEECLLIDMKDNLERFTDESDAFSYFEEYWR